MYNMYYFCLLQIREYELKNVVFKFSQPLLPSTFNSKGPEFLAWDNNSLR